ncbi:MAG: hypothetical protein JWP97_5660 [Labilithrix sp.]|nr:hypothetical protein [Labilithrix sp.]
MRTLHVAIAPESRHVVDESEVATIGAAIQRQVTRDFGPAWGIRATVDVFPVLEAVPADYWPVVLTGRHLGDDEGFHLTREGQPFAVVEAIAGWSLTASHEILEMLADPSGARLVEGSPPPFHAGATEPVALVDYLLEICDPCQSARDAYLLDGVLVSDFVLPAYFDGSGGRCSFTGAITEAHGLARGGALTYRDRARGVFVHVRHDDVREEHVVEERFIGPDDRRPPRAFVHATVKGRSDAPRVGGAEHTVIARKERSAHREASTARAAALRAEIRTLGTSEPLGLWRLSDDQVGERVRSALAQRAGLPAPVVALLEQAERELATVRASGNRPVAEEQFALSMVRSLAPARAGLLTARDVPGLGAYEHHDVRWAKALFEYAVHARAPFPVCPPQVDPPELTHAIPEGAVIAIAGDWGTHNAASARIGRAMADVHPTHTIHLGDVYYAGTDDEERKFVRDWPAGSAGAFTLNSNHEMFSGGHGYFSIALRSSKFNAQTYSYFALHDASWLFVGIDSGYHAAKNGIIPFQVGRLHEGTPEADPQVDWLRRVIAHPLAKRADGTPKRLCLFSHHHGLEPDGRETVLFAQVKAALEGRLPDVWYWGHVHGAAAYEVPYGELVFRGRLCAHGGVPYLPELEEANDRAAHIVWAERPRGGAPGTNGFAVIRVVDGSLVETFHDEAGAVRYTTRT